MHIIITFITALGGLFWAIYYLQRSGFDFNSLNPFLWHRRAQWRKKYNTKPIYNLSDPLDVAVLLLLGTAKCEGEISAEQKQQLLNILENKFHLSSYQASDYLLASSHLLKDEIYLVDNINKMLEPSGSSFSDAQINSLVELMREVAQLEGSINQEQQNLLEATQSYFAKLKKGTNSWG